MKRFVLCCAVLNCYMNYDNAVIPFVHFMAHGRLVRELLMIVGKPGSIVVPRATVGACLVRRRPSVATVDHLPHLSWSSLRPLRRPPSPPNAGHVEE
jgi:hypothetical protein